MRKTLRVFLDTSAILAGLNSPSGAAWAILAACARAECIPVISPQVIEEAERVIPKKFPHLNASWAVFLLLPPEITPPPSLAAVRRAWRILPTSDAPILASAIRARVDALVSWNTRDFMRPGARSAVKMRILKPPEFLDELRGNAHRS